MATSQQNMKLYGDVEVIKSQLSDVLHILKDNGSKGLVTRMGCAENDINQIKGILESEEQKNKTTENRKFEMSKGVKLALVSGGSP